MKSLIVIGLILAVTGALVVLLQRPVTFLSWESKTISDGDVFNRIQFTPGYQFDTWIMQQSHHGLDASPMLWDRLAIVVDKRKRPYQAKFFQFVAGELAMGAPHEAAPFGAPCFSCHANGPRAIRPKDDSGLLQKIQVSMLNIRIKSYLQVESVSGQPEQPAHTFQRTHAALKEPISLPSCTMCHGDGRVRQTLTRDHLTTAQFLVEHKQMPPWPFSLSNDDENKLKRWGL